MRIAIAAGVAVFLASSGSAIAAECTKGILWPYVRNPGDCLTEYEIKSGRLGSFTPAPGTVPPAAQQTATQPAATPPGQQTATQPAAATPSPTVVSAQSEPPKSAATIETCSKGLLWPFVRERGDCPTAAEIKSGATRPTATTVKATETAAPVSAVPSVAVATPSAAAPAPVPQAPAANSQSCSKGLLWPFVREPGDCPTAAEIKSGATRPTATTVKATESPAPATAARAVAPSAGSSAAAAPPAAPQPATAQPAGRAATATCSKGVFWPFVREPGDCPTEAELKTGAARPTAAPVQAVQTVATPAAAVPAVAPAAPPAATPASATETPAVDSTCHKGLLWPFVREAGDCPTDAEKGVKRPGRT